MLEAKQLTKSFGAVVAVRDVSFAVRKGEAVGFLGPNGAGKTTTFRMLAGTLSPDGGSVTIMGADLFEEPLITKRVLGYMPENAPLYPELSGRQYLQYRAELKGVPRSRRKVQLEKAAEQAGAYHMLGTQIGHLSKGYRQRMVLADALLGDPPVLLLDEPTSGLDPNQVVEIRALIRSLANDHAILLSTHVLSEVEATCDRAIVIHRGSVVAEGTLSELNADGVQKRAALKVRGDFQQIDALICKPHLSDFHHTQDADDTHLLDFPCSDDEQLARLIKHSVTAGFDVLHATLKPTPLLDVFAELTRIPQEEVDV